MLLRHMVFASLLTGLSVGLVAAPPARATSTQLRQVIAAAPPSVGLVDPSSAPVADPAVSFSAVAPRFDSQISTALLGTTEQRLYVQNLRGANYGWRVTLGTGPNAQWQGSSGGYDYNDASGAADGTDSDSAGGQLMVDPSAGQKLNGNSAASCEGDAGIVTGPAVAFDETAERNDIALLTASEASADAVDCYLSGVMLAQAIPAGQAAGDYGLPMVLSFITL